MNHCYQLVFDIQSYWHIGEGRQAGVYADNLVRKDQGLPFVPGTSINGLLRDAFELAEKNQWFGVTQATTLATTNALFGIGGTNGTECQGLIQLTNATLSASEQAYFSANTTAKTQLYRVLASTAINAKGVASDGSLRSIEVSVPMKLTAQLTLNQAHPEFDQRMALFDNKFGQWLALAASLLTGIGAKRSRGFGQVEVTVKPVASTVTEQGA